MSTDFSYLNEAYEEDEIVLKKSITLSFCVLELVTLTTSALSGEAKTTQSFLASAIVIKFST